MISTYMCSCGIMRFLLFTGPLPRIWFMHAQACAGMRRHTGFAHDAGVGLQCSLLMTPDHVAQFRWQDGRACRQRSTSHCSQYMSEAYNGVRDHACGANASSSLRVEACGIKLSKADSWFLLIADAIAMNMSCPDARRRLLTQACMYDRMTRRGAWGHQRLSSKKGCVDVWCMVYSVCSECGLAFKKEIRLVRCQGLDSSFRDSFRDRSPDSDAQSSRVSPCGSDVHDA